MTTRERPPGLDQDRSANQDELRVTGDARFVPAPHSMIIDRRVSYAAFRLWCVLHRLWFLHEPPVMEVLQELMGTTITDKATHAEIWQPATRRSIERWLCELEAASWLVWVRREETTRRYHLRTNARSGGDSAVLHELRSLLNSGKATMAEVQALLNLVPALPADATAESHDTTAESQHPTLGLHDTTAESHDTTAESQLPAGQATNTTTESHRATLGSHDTTAESHHATLGSHDTTAESHDAISGSHQQAAQGVLMRQKNGLKHEIHQITDLDSEITPPPPPAASAEGGDGVGQPSLSAI